VSWPGPEILTPPFAPYSPTSYSVCRVRWAARPCSSRMTTGCAVVGGRAAPATAWPPPGETEGAQLAPQPPLNPRRTGVTRRRLSMRLA